MRATKKPVEIEFYQWWYNGDHPDDGAAFEAPGEFEGKLVRYFRRPEPEYAGNKVHDVCGKKWHWHGWIETLEGGHTVCPGDVVITGVKGEHYPCKPDIFVETYDFLWQQSPFEFILPERPNKA